MCLNQLVSLYLAKDSLKNRHNETLHVLSFYLIIVHQIYDKTKFRKMARRVFSAKDNPKTFVGTEFLRDNPDIVELDLSGKNISYLAPTVGCLKDLEVLDLSNTSVRSIPLEVGTLPKLRVFKIDNTPILNDPDSMYRLLKLNNSEELLAYLREANQQRPELPPFSYSPIEKADDKQFSFLSWNILADHAVHDFLFPLCFEKYLNKEYREKRIIKKLHDLKPDIICLQEIEYCQVTGPFLGEFLKQRYYWAFAPKGRIVKKPEGLRGPVPGQATLFNLSKFKLLAYNMLEVRQSQLIWNPTMKINGCDDVVLFVLIQSLSDPSKNILIINVHMFYRIPEVRNAFADVIVKEAKNFASWYAKNYEIIITGDFNDRIESESMQTFLKQDDRFESVYDKMDKKDIITYNFTPKQMCRIDHIVATNGLKAVSILNGMKSNEMSEKCPYVPSEFHPSDHFPVGAIFEFNG